MKSIVIFACLLLGFAVSVHSQKTDPNSTPPGAPIFERPVDDPHFRINPLHPGNASQRLAVSNFAIIESQSFNSGHAMDVVWYNVVTGMGHTATILPQTALDNLASLGGYNILIVSSGVITLPAGRVTTIQQFVQSGRSVYLQGEYLPSYSGNIALGTIMAATGGSLTLGSTVSGNLAPTTILNAYATAPNSVPNISYHWYGCTANGCNNFEYFMRYGASNIGFVYCPTNAAQGDVIQSTDQDWVNQSTSLPLMQNIAFYLISGNACTVVCGILAEASEMSLVAKLRENGSVVLDWDLDGEVSIGKFEVYCNGRWIGETPVGEKAGLTFQWVDERLPSGPLTYEVCHLDANGNVTVAAKAEAFGRGGELLWRIRPTADGFVVRMAEGEHLSELQLVSLTGQVIELDAVSQGGELSIPMREMAAGAYLIQGRTTRGASVREKLVWAGR
ncbi:MAG: hypothetical protein U0176_03915 [Bacteroidia bacterium]